MIDLSNETMVHVKHGDIEYLQFRRLLEYEDILFNCYTLKGNNNSYDICDKDSYKDLCDDLNIKEDSIKRIEKQIHSDKIGIVNSKDEFITDVDGLITDKKGIYLSLRFADCTPIILFCPNKKVIGNIHSGWRGTIQKIGQKGAIKMMKNYDIKPEELLCFIGPSINKCHFEVSKDVKEEFENTFSYLLNTDDFISKIEGKEDKYLIDTNIINVKILEEIGIPNKNIIQSNICTVCNSEYMHSYRKDKENAGRNTAIIGLK